ncbi:hypothetical protein ABZ721_39935 [Streptomyces sp. NPDC006733]|uniref:hypothetical protein n=1 Tax=Streptomyces sp. NPDC006733 TaxID=3155460 RepID=UPI0034097EB7
MTGVELDSVTAAICQALYPQARILNEEFQDSRIKTGEYDATVALQQLEIGEWTRYGLTPITPPPWSASTTDTWHRDYASAPVRLSITAKSASGQWARAVGSPRHHRGRLLTDKRPATTARYPAI